jgi:hypothetical protein
MGAFTSYFPEESEPGTLPPEVVVRDIAAWNRITPIIQQDGNLVHARQFNAYADMHYHQSWPKGIGRIALACSKRSYESS